MAVMEMIVAAIILPLIAVVVVYFWLAPTYLFWVFVPEGYAIIVLKGGEIYKAFISLKGHTLDNNWNVVLDGTLVPQEIVQKIQKEEIKKPYNLEVIEKKYIYKEPKHLFGGLRFYGIYPFTEILKYNFDWTHLHSGNKVVNHNEKGLRKVMLKTDLYIVQHKLDEKESAEDLDGVPIGIAWVVPIKIVNLHEAFFLYRNWLTMIDGTTKALLGVFVARYRYKKDLLDMSAGKGIEKRQEDKGITKEEIKVNHGDDLQDKFWDELIEKLTKEAQKGGAKTETTSNGLRVFGVEIQKIGFARLTIEPAAVYRKLTTLQYEEQQKKEARIIKAEGIKEARAIQATGTIIQAIMEITEGEEGETKKEKEERVRKIISENPKLRDKFLEVGIDLVKRDMSLEKDGLTDIRIEGKSVTGLEGLIALFKKLGEKGEKKGGGEPK